jgi:hypothetical protein
MRHSHAAALYATPTQKGDTVNNEAPKRPGLQDLEYNTLVVHYKSGRSESYARARYGLQAGPSGFILNVLARDGRVLLANLDAIECVEMSPAQVQVVSPSVARSA